MLKVSDMEKMFEEGRSLIDHLPYADHVDGVFLNVDGSVGQIWELVLSGCEGLESVRLDEISRGIEGLVARMPQGLHVQLMVWSDTDVAPALEAYRAISAQGEGETLISRIVDEKLLHMLKDRDVVHGNVCSRRLRVFFTVRYFPLWSPLIKQECINGYFRGVDGVAKHFASGHQGVHERGTGG